MATKNPTPILVIMLDEISHELPEHPFCSDMTCGCHSDHDLMEEFIFDKLNDGTLTFDEASRLYHGKQVTS